MKNKTNSRFSNWLLFSLRLLAVGDEHLASSRPDVLFEKESRFMGRLTRITFLFAILLLLTFTVSVNRKVEAQKKKTDSLSVVSCTAAPQGMVAWWPGEGNADDIRGENDGTLEGAVSFATGKVGQAFNFDGSTADVKFPASASLNVGAGNGLTIDAWISPTDLSTPRPLVEWNNGSTAGTHFWMSAGVAGDLFGNIVDTSGNSHYVSSPPVLTANTYQHVALTYDKTNGNAAMYVNGQAVSTPNLGVFTPQTTHDLYLALRLGGTLGGSRFIGQMDEVEIFNRSLSQAEIQAIFDAGSAGKCRNWSSAAPLTSARYGMATGVIDGKIYVAGGIIPSVAFLSTLEVYDPAMNTWSTLAPLPAARYTAFAEVIGGKLYVAGGYDGSSTVATLFVYDPTTNTWSTLAPMATPRALLTGGVINGKLYVAGGYTSTTTFASVNNLEVYDPATNTWATKTPMPNSGRYGAGGAVFTNKLYVAGGFGNDVSYINILEVYDPLMDSWTAKSPMPKIQYLLAAGVLAGQLYAIGGQDGSNPLNIVQVYEPITDTWSIAPAMPTARLTLSAEVVGNSIYAMGGYNGTAASATHEVFTPPSCATTPAGLVGWWAGDGDARDNTGVNNGTLNLVSGHSGIAVGHVGQTFTFQPGEYVGVPDSNSLEMTTQFTLAAWIRPTDVNNYRQIISKFGTSGNFAYQLGLSPNGGLRVDFSADGTSYDALIAPNNSITPGMWQHVAVTFNAGSVKLYVNGVEVAANASSLTSIYPNGTVGLDIGRDASIGGQPFSGEIDEAMVFNRALSVTEINDVLAAGKNGLCKSAATSAGANSQSIVGDQTISFQNVTTPGTTTSHSTPPLSAGDLPVGYTHTGLAYDISTTVSFTGPVQICFNLPAVINPAAPTNLRVLHLEGATLVDRTTSRLPSSSTLCSSVTSLSPFVIAAASAPTAAPGSISGQITTPNGLPLGGVLVTLNGAGTTFAISDAAGEYRFSDLELGDFYTITPSLANHTFSPAQRSFALLGNRTDAVFTALADARPTANPLDSPEFFVRQQYLDFLGREPDPGGLRYWAGEIRACSTDAHCASSRRTSVSAAFFVEQEFQRTGNFIYLFYKSSLGRQPNYAEFGGDRGKVLGGAALADQQDRFAEEWVRRDAFRQQYPDTMSASEFVNKLFDTAELARFDIRQQQIEAISRDGKTRAQVLRDLIDTPELVTREYNRSFVLMQYFGYLHRNPDLDGYNFWLHVLDQQAPGNYRGMVCAFVTAAEYQQRFSSVVTHTNADCQP